MLKVAATQMACDWDLPANLGRAEKLILEADDHSETVLVREFDRDAIHNFRDARGFYRDRRPDLYQTIATLNGERQSVT